jgi:hypothetical protein
MLLSAVYTTLYSFLQQLAFDWFLDFALIFEKPHDRERVPKLGMWKLLYLKKLEPARKSDCNLQCLVTIS